MKIIFNIILFLTLSGYVSGEEYMREITSVGISQTKQKSDAINDAMWKVIREAITTIIPEDVFEKNYDVIRDKFSDARKYISSYKIISEKLDENGYSVEMLCNVDIRLLKNILRKIGLIEKEFYLPDIRVTVKNNVDCRNFEMKDKEVEDIIRNSFIKDGLTGLIFVDDITDPVKNTISVIIEFVGKINGSPPVDVCGINARKVKGFSLI